jgi:hypothetical protein
MLKPMHPVTADLSRLPFPCWSQEKHDGVGGLVCPSMGLHTKEGLPLPNPEARAFLSQRALWGHHGELTAPGGFEAAQSAFMGSGALPSGWRFMVFDLAGSSMAFVDRLAKVRQAVASLGAQDVVQVSPALCHRSLESVNEAFAEVVARNGEGLVLKAGTWGYREGNASSTRCEAVKLKPTGELEGVIRSVRARLDDPDAVGSVTLEYAGRLFSAPVAMPRAQAASLWTQRGNLPGRLGTVRLCGKTRDGAPRGAVFIGVRRDLAA